MTQEYRVIKPAATMSEHQKAVWNVFESAREDTNVSNFTFDFQQYSLDPVDMAQEILEKAGSDSPELQACLDSDQSAICAFITTEGPEVVTAYHRLARGADVGYCTQWQVRGIEFRNRPPKRQIECTPAQAFSTTNMLAPLVAGMHPYVSCDPISASVVLVTNGFFEGLSLRSGLHFVSSRHNSLEDLSPAQQKYVRRQAGSKAQQLRFDFEYSRGLTQNDTTKDLSETVRAVIPIRMPTVVDWMHYALPIDAAATKFLEDSVPDEWREGTQ